MLELGKSKSKFASRVVTTAPDVATSTNLGGFIIFLFLFLVSFFFFKKKEKSKINKIKLGKSTRSLRIKCSKRYL